MIIIVNSIDVTLSLRIKRKKKIIVNIINIFLIILIRDSV